MNEAELYEEIRALLREAQVSKVSDPWKYTDEDFVPQTRSALRNLRVRGLLVEGAMDSDGIFTTEPTEIEGLLIAYFVAERLVSGDLLQKLADGELGMVFKTGPDLIDTKTATRSFEDFGKRWRMEFDALLAIAMAGQADGLQSVLSSENVQSDEGEV